MKILGIESSCDETAAAVVEDGSLILSNVVATQIPFHQKFSGVVPEIAGRKHIEWISPVVQKALDDAGLSLAQIDAIAATNRPGLMGSLLVGLTFAKTLAWAAKKPFLAVNHLEAHLHAARLREKKDECAVPLEFPYVGLLCSGGHSVIAIVDGFGKIRVIGTTIDDAAGEAFDKAAKFYGFGYPGGVAIDNLAKNGDCRAADFPMPNLKGEEHRFDFSYSGLKTAATAQIDQFWNSDFPRTNENIAAAFQEAACKILARKLIAVCDEFGIKTVVAGGGVAANSRLRSMLAERKDLQTIFPPLKLCGDNGAMVAGAAFERFRRGESSPLSTTAFPRDSAFRHKSLRESRAARN